jgi:hypothetical protein
MVSIYQKLAIVATGTALSFTFLKVNLAQATTPITQNYSAQSSNSTVTIVENELFNETKSLQQKLAGELSTNNLIAQGSFPQLGLYYLQTGTNGTGFFSVPHGLERYTPDGIQIVGLVVSVQHVNGNWHTLELSHSVDNRFWWNNTYVQGLIASPNFYNRPVRIVLITRDVVG